MKRKRIFRLIFYFIIVLLAGFTDVESAMAASPEKPEESYSLTDEMLGELELEEVQEMIDSLLDQKSIDIMEALKAIIQGQQPVSRETVVEIIYEGVFGAFSNQRKILLQIILLIICGGLFANFASTFDNSQIGEISFYAIYLVLFVLLLHSFAQLSADIRESLLIIVNLMKVAAPSYFLVVSLSTGITTAHLVYEGILILLLSIEAVILTFVLPCISLYVLLQMVNFLSKEDTLSKLAELLETIIQWSLKTMLGVVVGFQIIQGLVAPVIDALRRTAIGKTASAIPGIGGAMNAVTEIVLTSAVLVRNSLGAVFLIILLIMGITPLVCYGATALLYKLLAALAQPISDKRIVGCLSTVGEGCVMLMKTMFTVEILCMVTLLLLMNTR